MVMTLLDEYRAQAARIAARGSRVFIGDLDAELAAAEAAELGSRGCGLDVRSRASFAEFLDAVDGPPTVLVNNAGIMPAGAFADEDDAAPPRSSTSTSTAC
jgi:NAD(P)-dependent dehydrogenase (short-subunit alcohol dehydrogenase family)